MKTLFNKKNRALLYIFLAMSAIILSAIILLPHGQLGFILLSSIAFVSFIALFFGLIPGLGLALILLFVVGSVLFWAGLTGKLLFEDQLPIIEVLTWMILVVVIPMLVGYSAEHIKFLNAQNKDLQEQIRSLVAVDPVTGFDNKDRMLIELKSQFSRSKRYGHTFSFLVIKLNYYDQFQKLYGEKELTNLLKHSAHKIMQVTRASDLRFRIGKDSFAILFTDTPIKDIHIIIEKLTKELQVFQLQNKKYITLTFEFGYAGYEKELADYMQVYENAVEQVDGHVS